MGSTLPRLVALSAVLLAGCGSSSTVDGTIDGVQFKVAETLSTLVGGTSGSFAIIALGSKSGLCDALGKGELLANDELLLLEVGTADAALDAVDTPVAGEDFPVVPDIQEGPFAFVAAFLITDTCMQELAAFGASGEIAITGDDDNDTEPSGTGTVRFNTGDSVSLAFEQPTQCASLLLLRGSGTGTLDAAGCP